MAIEQTIFYPAVKDIDSEMVSEGYQEHAIAELALKRLLSTAPDDETFVAKVTALRDLIEHHVEEEEDQLFGSRRHHGRRAAGRAGRRNAVCLRGGVRRRLRGSAAGRHGNQRRRSQPANRATAKRAEATVRFEVADVARMTLTAEGIRSRSDTGAGGGGAQQGLSVEAGASLGRGM